MAIIFEDATECSICGKVLKSTDKIIGWQAFLNQEHKFWKYSDSGMHQDCFENWEHKDEFEELYKYQPLIDFEDEYLKAMIEEYGMPDWLKEIKDYRENKV